MCVDFVYLVIVLLCLGDELLIYFSHYILRRGANIFDGPDMGFLEKDQLTKEQLDGFDNYKVL